MGEIDVSECIFYSEKEYISNDNGYTEYTDYCSCYTDGHCLEHNCYYKRLQLAVAENEELRAINDHSALVFLEEENKKEQKIKKYKTALDKIEKIITNFALEFIVILPDLLARHNYELIAKQYGESIKEILQKIKEVKENE